MCCRNERFNTKYFFSEMVLVFIFIFPNNILILFSYQNMLGGRYFYCDFFNSGYVHNALTFRRCPWKHRNEGINDIAEKKTLERWPEKKADKTQKSAFSIAPSSLSTPAPTSLRIRVLKVLHQSLTGLNDKCTGNLLEKCRKVYRGN